MAAAPRPDQVAASQRLSLANLARPHWPRLTGGAAALAVVSAAGALYAYLAGPLVALLLGGAPATGSMLLALVPQSLRPAPGEPALLAVALLLVVIALIKGLAQLVQAVLLDVTAERIGHELRVRLYGHLLRRPLVGPRPRAVGDLLARLLDDVGRVQQATVGAAIGLLRDGLAALALLAVALWLSWSLTLVALGALPVVALAVTLIGRRVRGAAGRSQQDVGALAARAGAGLAALREVKSCGAEERELARVARRSDSALTWAARRVRARASGPLINEVLAAAALGATLVYASGSFAEQPGGAERLVSFFTAILLLYRPIKGISTTLHAVAAGRASIERVAEVLAEPVERPPAETLPPLERALRLERVAFRYPAGQWELPAVDLELRVGRVLAVTGPSGVGKSTLANIVCGLTRPGWGTLRWDNEDLASWPLASLRGAVALVPQQPLILDGTLAENLRFAAPDADEQALWRALEATALDGWVRSLPEGLETLVGPVVGRQPSVGQLQRLSVARALLRQARVIVLDEPTSALEPEAAARLGETIRRAAGEAAVMIVAHDRELVAAVADEVYQLGRS